MVKVIRLTITRITVSILYQAGTIVCFNTMNNHSTEWRSQVAFHAQQEGRQGTHKAGRGLRTEGALQRGYSVGRRYQQADQNSIQTTTAVSPPRPSTGTLNSPTQSKV